MTRITDFILKRPIFVIVLLLLITVFFGYQIMDKARIETDLDQYRPQDHPAFVQSDKYEDIFAIRDSIIIAIENEQGIYNPETLKKIEDITQQVQDIKGIDADDVRSLATADNIEGSELGLEIDPFYEQTPQTQPELEQLKDDVRSNEMIDERLVSKDETATLIMAELRENGMDRMALYQEVKGVMDEYEGPEKIYIAGQPVVEGTLAYLMPRDMKKMVPLVILVIILVLLFTLKSWKSALLTLGVVLFSTIWAFGLMAFFQIPIYSVSTMIPVMLIALGVADGIHLLSHLHQAIKENPDIGLRQAVQHMIRDMWKPVVMTSITTAVGFISLLTSEVYPIKYFGIFTAFGVMSAMVFSLAWIPAGLKIVKLPQFKKKEKQAGQGHGFFYGWANRMLAHKQAVIIIAIVVVIVGVIGLQKVWIDSSLLSKFEKDEDIVQADNFINEHFGGTTSLNLIFTGEDRDDLKRPEYLQDIWELQKELEQMEMVGDTYGVNDYLRRINKVMNEDQEQYNRVPDNQDLIAQYLLLYSMSGDPEDLDKLIDYDYRRANLRVSLKADNARIIKRVIDRIEEITADSSLQQLEVEYAGSAYNNMIFTGLILDGQIKSLVISVILIIILLGLMFKSPVAGILGSLPIIITAIVNFGVMGYSNISLNTTTALISSIAVGMGIDYSIHLLSRYREFGQAGYTGLEAAQKTMNQSGRAIAFNALVVISGFLVLIFSNFPPNRELGMLVSLSMFVSFLGTLTVVVVLIDRFRPKFIWKQTGGNNNEK